MSTTILQTKLFTPRIRPSFIPRPRLIKKLNEGLNAQLTLISAPAGFGKTTLVAAWLKQCDRPAVWLSLDEGDNDPARFLAYIVAALRRIGITSVEADLVVNRASPVRSIEAALTDLINDIAAQEINLITVLDDYHLITDQTVHQALAFLLDHLPRQMHLVIVTRADLPFPVALLRGRGELHELRQVDLRFTGAEAALFLNRIMGLDLHEVDIEALNKRTEGWITGLQMAAVSMQGREDVHAYIQVFAGSDRYIADYLVEEVLDRQPPYMQDFLLKTAVLQRFTAPLCDAVMQFTDSQSQPILEDLEHANLFVMPLDDKRLWYRYHRLFSDLLRQRLQQTYPEQVADLHRRASAWYEEQGLPAAAIDHAFAAADFERAACLIDETAETFFMRSETATVQHWCSLLPDEVLANHPELNFYFAWALLQDGRAFDRVEIYLQQLDKSGFVPGRVIALRALLAAYQDQFAEAVELSGLALELLPGDDPFLRFAVAWHANFSYVSDGDLRANKQALAESAKAGLATGNLTIAVGALCQLARLSARQGHLRRAESLYQQALDTAVDGQQQLPIAGLALLGLGELAREWNELDTAVKYLVDGIHLTGQWRDLASLAGFVSLVRTRQAQGDEAGADDALAQLKTVALRSDATEVDDLVADFIQARLELLRGNIDGALRWAEEKGLNRIKTPILLEKEGDNLLLHLRKYEALVLARIWIAQDRSSDALSLLLQPMLNWLAKRERADLQIETRILCALAWQSQKAMAEAVNCLKEAVSLGQSGGYTRIFVDEGQVVAELLKRIQTEDEAVTLYIRRLLDAFEDERPTDSYTATSQTLIEPLSERELQILRLIAEGMSNREIAQELILSLPTIKWHTSNIYGKLGVRNRTTAVAKARALKLLPTS